MPFYKLRPFRTEVIQVTAENINNVFTWVSSSTAVNAHSLTADSFVLKYLQNPEQVVTIGSFVMKRTNDSFGVFADGAFQDRWVEITEEEANSLPTINRQTKSLEDAWTRFSELTF